MAESKGFNPIRFATEVRQDASKVTWTTWQETLITTIMVFVAATFFFTVDQLLSQGVRWILSLGA